MPKSKITPQPIVGLTVARAEDAIQRQNTSSEDSPLLQLFDPHLRIARIRRGIPASSLESLARRMGITKEQLLTILGLSAASVQRQERSSGVLSRDQSERLLGVETLIGLVQMMVNQSGNPAGFDAARWLSGWLREPLPALAGATPASYLDTFEGQKLVAELLAMSQSGAYA